MKSEGFVMSLRRRRGWSADFDDQAPNNDSTKSSSYPGTGSETAPKILDVDGSDDPPYTPTTGEEDHEDDPASSPRRNKRLRPFYASSETVVRERLMLIEISSDYSPSTPSASEDEKEAGMSNQSSEFADDKFPPVPATIAHESASVSVSVESRSTPRAAYRRKQNHPFRCPVM